LLWARPRAVYFSVTRHDSAAAGFENFYPQVELPFSQRKLPMAQIERPEAHEALAAWKARQGK
ncbi:MAG TPA: hypothetical protein VF815_36745, partial [Myxococcaceae bacterium]